QVHAVDERELERPAAGRGQRIGPAEVGVAGGPEQRHVAVQFLGDRERGIDPDRPAAGQAETPARPYPDLEVGRRIQPLMRGGQHLHVTHRNSLSQEPQVSQPTRGGLRIVPVGNTGTVFPEFRPSPVRGDRSAPGPDHPGRMVSPRKDQRRPGPGRLPAGLRVVGTVLVFITSFALLPGIVLAVGAATFERHRYAPPDRTPEISADPPAHDPGRPTAVVVVGNGGANVADVLAPYEVLAGTGAFNVYVVAPERRPVTLLGGLDVLPDLSFAELDRRLEGAAPDVTVVPELLVADRYDRPVIEWLRGTASRELVLAVCSGARLVAAAGLLDG